MKGDLIINGKDAWDVWKMSLADGSVTALMTPPSAKAPITNTSRLRNGKIVIRSNKSHTSLKRISDRDVSLIFNLYAENYTELMSNLNALISELMSGETVLKTSYLPNVAFHLDYVNCTQFSQIRGEYAQFIFKFNEPDPTNRTVNNG